MDAGVQLPESGQIPMYKLESTGFTQEQVTGMYDYLFKGKETYIITGEEMTKSECERMIVDLQGDIARFQADDELEEEERQKMIDMYQSQIDELNTQYDSLPEDKNIKKVPVDSTLTEQKTETEKGSTTYMGVMCQTDDDEIFTVDNFPVDSSAWPDLYYNRKTELSYMPDSGLVVTEQEANEKKSQDLTLSWAEAKALADGLFAAADVDVEMVQTELLKGYTETGSEEDDDVELRYDDAYTAYRFCYARMIDQTPVAVTSSTYVSDDESALIWPYEQISVTVNKDGILEVKWTTPVTLRDTVSNDVNILSFDDAKAIFEEMTPLIYSGKIADREDGFEGKFTLDVQVDQIRLSLMRVKDSGAERTGLYVPTWVFYGTEAEHFVTNEDDWTNTEATPWIILAVNAVDGTIIDVVEGY